MPLHHSLSARCFGQIATLAIACALPSPAAHAADLLDAWQAARSHDAGLLAAQATLRAAEEKIPQGDALLAPRLGLAANVDQARQQYRPGEPSNAHPGSNVGGQSYGVGLVFTQPIFDAASTAARDRLHREALQARIVYLQAEQDLMLRVARSYFDLLLAREALTLATAQQQAVGEQLGLAKESYELGLTSVTDADDAQARHDNLLAAEILNRNDLANKADAFMVLTAVDPQRLAAISPSLVAVAPAPTAIDTWLDQARRDNPSLRRLGLDLEIAEKSIDQYRWQGAPVVAVTASAGRQYEAGSISTSGGRDATTSGAIGLRLTIPLFDAGSRQSLLRQAFAIQDQQRHSLEAGQREVVRVTRLYFAALRDGVERIRALERARVSGESSVRSSKVGQEVGVRTIIDVLNAEQNHYQTLYNLTAARCDYLFNQLQFAASVGALSEATIARVNAALVAL